MGRTTKRTGAAAAPAKAGAKSAKAGKQTAKAGKQTARADTAKSASNSATTRRAGAPKPPGSAAADGDVRRGRGRPAGRGVLDVDTIVDAARRIIADEGHESFTLRRLGDELQVTAPALYAHFGSKDDLVREVAHREFDGFIEHYSQISEADPVERLRYISRHYVQYAKENAELFQLMLTFPPGFFRRDFFDPGSTSNSFGARLFRPRARAVGEAIAEGRFVDHDPFLIGLALFTAVHGVATFLLSEPALDEEFESALVDLVVDTMLRGLAP